LVDWDGSGGSGVKVACVAIVVVVVDRVRCGSGSSGRNVVAVDIVVGGRAGGCVVQRIVGEVSAGIVDVVIDVIIVVVSIIAVQKRFIKIWDIEVL
jgi:hypothetical protein